MISQIKKRTKSDTFLSSISIYFSIRNIKTAKDNYPLDTNFEFLNKFS